MSYRKLFQWPLRTKHGVKGFIYHIILYHFSPHEFYRLKGIIIDKVEFIRWIFVRLFAVLTKA